MKVYSISILIHNDKSIEAETIKEYESLIKDGGCIILCIEKIIFDIDFRRHQYGLRP